MLPFCSSPSSSLLPEEAEPFRGLRPRLSFCVSQYDEGRDPLTCPAVRDTLLPKRGRDDQQETIAEYVIVIIKHLDLAAKNLYSLSPSW